MLLNVFIYSNLRVCLDVIYTRRVNILYVNVLTAAPPTANQQPQQVKFAKIFADNFTGCWSIWFRVYRRIFSLNWAFIRGPAPQRDFINLLIGI